MTPNLLHETVSEPTARYMMFGVRNFMDRDGRSLTMTVCYTLMVMAVCLRGSLGQVTINWVIPAEEARRLGLGSKCGTKHDTMKVVARLVCGLVLELAFVFLNSKLVSCIKRCDLCA